MNENGLESLVTPIHLKLQAEQAWPAEPRVFYRLARNGLFLCRNHPFFQSCVPARRWPQELEEQAAFLRPRFPPVPQRLFERIVGFFARVGEEHGAEAAVLLTWDAHKHRVGVYVPDQIATVSRGWRRPSPIGLHYDPPVHLPPHVLVFGDVHSHVDLAAFASSTDAHDEVFRPGLHVVVGRISSEPPQVHVEAVVDGERFELTAQRVIEGYERRNLDVPPRWLERVRAMTTWEFRRLEREREDGRVR